MTALSGSQKETSQHKMSEKKIKYIFTLGGAASGIGKGVTTSSIGCLLQALGYRCTYVKQDPYMSCDASLLAPDEHGECAIVGGVRPCDYPSVITHHEKEEKEIKSEKERGSDNDDGPGECDLDIANAQRMLGIELGSSHNMTSGKVYSRVLKRERRGDFLGKTVSMVPHVTNEIIEWIERVAELDVRPSKGNARKEGKGSEEHRNDSKRNDFCLVELGGTVGDLESAVFLEAIRQMIWKHGRENCFVIMVSLVPVISPQKSDSEPKTKPTQHAVVQLRAAGIQPDLLVCRSSKPLEQRIQDKLKATCMVKAVVGVHDVSSIYRIPMLLRECGVHLLLGKHFDLDLQSRSFTSPDWLQHEAFVHQLERSDMREVKIALVGKYLQHDAYLSVSHALTHAAVANQVKLTIVWVPSESLETTDVSARASDASTPVPDASTPWEWCNDVHGVIVPGGFGHRGTEGMILATKWAREQGVPWFGICLGLQIGVIEYARHVCGLLDATSEEFVLAAKKENQAKQNQEEQDKKNNKQEKDESKKPDQVIAFMPEGWRPGDKEVHYGNTMRLGRKVTVVQPKTLASTIYQHAERVVELHRHRYEVNPAYVPHLQKSGLTFSGVDEELGQRMEMMEVSDHPFFFAVQGHPEFQSRAQSPSPPFHAFLAACKQQASHD